MLVRDAPLAVDLAVADSCADPHIDLLEIGSRSADMVQTVPKATSAPAEIASERIS
jgi:hypothetical protein